jgi:hypothetical protein
MDDKVTQVSARAVTQRYGPNSPELETMLSVAYGFNAKTAKQIIKEHEENPLMHSEDRYLKAVAFMAALTTKPTVVSTKPGWKRAPLTAQTQRLLGIQ